MRTLHQLTNGRTEEQARKEIAQCGDSLGGLKENEAVWQAIKSRFELAIAEGNDWVTHPDTKNREWAAGCVRGLNDLWQELSDLRDGSWKRWPEFKAEKKVQEEED